MEIITQCCWIFFKILEFFWKLSLNIVENVAKVEIFLFLFLAECHFFTLINYSTYMCRTSYEPMVLIVACMTKHDHGQSNSNNISRPLSQGPFLDIGSVPCSHLVGSTPYLLMCYAPRFVENVMCSRRVECVIYWIYKCVLKKKRIWTI